MPDIGTNAEPGFAPLKTQNVRTKERIRDLAEVFTAQREVEAMLDLVGDPAHNPDTVVLEPSCGNGNFLVAVLERKMQTVFSSKHRPAQTEIGIVRSVMSIYGVDISEGNVLEARERLYAQVADAWSRHMNTRKPSRHLFGVVKSVLKRNILVGDFLNGKHEVVVTEYVPISPGVFVLTDYLLSDIRKPLRVRGKANMTNLSEKLDGQG